MRYRDFGMTEVVVSEIGLGSHMFPLENPRWDGYHGKGIRVDVAYAERRFLVERALELGVTLFDCDFKFEKELLGRIFHDLKKRDQVVLAGVIDYRPEGYAHLDWRDFDRAFEAVLKQLQTDYLDILDLRMSEALADSPFPEEFSKHTTRMKEAGKLRAVSIYTGDGSDELILQVARTGCCDALFRGFGFLNPHVRQHVLPRAEELNLGFLGFIPFQKGWFFRCAREAGLLHDGGAEMARLGLKWVLAHPRVSSVLVGVSTLAELEVNCTATDEIELAADDHQKLQKLTRTKAYERFLALMNEQNPAVVYDWRVTADQEKS